MLSKEIVDQFILRRGMGLSYREISIEINVSEKTLKQWGKKYADKIAQAENKGLAVAIEAYNMAKADRLRALAKSLESIDKEIEKRDLSSVPVSRLIHLKMAGLKLGGDIIGGSDQKHTDSLQQYTDIWTRLTSGSGDE